MRNPIRATITMIALASALGVPGVATAAPEAAVIAASYNIAMPARLSRVPITTLHPASTNPVEAHQPCLRNS